MVVRQGPAEEHMYLLARKVSQMGIGFEVLS